MPDESRPDWTESASARERVRSVALTLGEPRTANWVATEADVAHETAKKYLDQLVEDGKLISEASGEQTVYRPDRIGLYLDEIHELYGEHSPQELADHLAEMTEQIDSWRQEYGVGTPNELRESIGSVEDPSEAADRREIATEWERLEYRQSVVEDTLRLYDRFPGDDASTFA